LKGIERVVETGIFASRWLLAPFYLGLVVCLVLLLLHFIIQLVVFIPQFPTATQSEMILGVLGLVDITFTANLVLIVILSGYENFVSKFEIESHDRPDWMTEVDFTGLKQKLLTSIVAISAIQVLKAFMSLEKFADPSTLIWLVSIHLVFVITMLLLAIADRVGLPTTRRAEHLDNKPGKANDK
jgi:uncharacterized protein (TIGR00645 family)